MPRLAGWRVRVTIHRSRRVLQQVTHSDRRTNACYRPSATVRQRVLGTVHLHRDCDEGTVAHELLHAVYDWMKVRQREVFTLAAEETACRNLARLVRIVTWHLQRMAADADC